MCRFEWNRGFSKNRRNCRQVLDCGDKAKRRRRFGSGRDSDGQHRASSQAEAKAVNRFGRWLFSMAPLMVCGRAVVVAIASEEFVVRTWQTEDGLPQNSGTAITQTSDGYVLKENAVEDLLAAVRAAANGDLFISPLLSNFF